MSGGTLQSARQLSQDQERRRGFTSFKTHSGPLEYTLRCCRDVLIQATLDQDISSIGEAPAGVLIPSDSFYAFGAIYANAKCLVAVCEKSSGLCFKPPTGFDIAFAVARQSILSEPICSNSRTIWSKRDELVPPSTQVFLLRMLAGKPDGITLRDASAIFPSEEKGIDALLSMAARGLIWLDNRKILSDSTPVKLGPVMRESI